MNIQYETLPLVSFFQQTKKQCVSRTCNETFVVEPKTTIKHQLHYIQLCDADTTIIPEVEHRPSTRFFHCSRAPVFIEPHVRPATFVSDFSTPSSFPLQL